MKGSRENRDHYWPWESGGKNAEMGPLGPLGTVRCLSSFSEQLSADPTAFLFLTHPSVLSFGWWGVLSAGLPGPGWDPGQLCISLSPLVWPGLGHTAPEGTRPGRLASLVTCGSQGAWCQPALSRASCLLTTEPSPVFLYPEGQGHCWCHEYYDEND